VIILENNLVEWLSNECVRPGFQVDNISASSYATVRLPVMLQRGRSVCLSVSFSQRQLHIVMQMRASSVSDSSVLGGRSQ